MRRISLLRVLRGGAFVVAVAIAAVWSAPESRAQAPASAGAGPLLTGAVAYGDWSRAAPGVRHLITPADMPPPYATESVSNAPRRVTRPANAWPQVPPGFTVSAFATDLKQPRQMRRAPNGDIFLAESGAGRIRVLRAADGAERAESAKVFADGLGYPFGIAFYPPGPDPQWVYVGTEDEVLRYPYRNGDLKARGKPEKIAQLPSGGHVTRDVLFSPDGRTLYVSVGSASNDAEEGMTEEQERANILAYNPDGSGLRVYASGLRNPVGLAIDPATGDLWTAVNERDGLGDNLPPDYVTRVREGGFYGWPWYYIGPNQDPRHRGARPELAREVQVPDVLLQPHSAPLGLAVYDGLQFPAAYRGDILVALHGSWNRAQRTGYEVARVRLENGKPTGEYDDFMTGFVTARGEVWGRPAGVAVARDGALLVSDDGGGVVWRIAYGRRQPSGR
jgi:glucose/arabinose dehydrogenase